MLALAFILVGPLEQTNGVFVASDIVTFAWVDTLVSTWSQRWKRENFMIELEFDTLTTFIFMVKQYPNLLSLLWLVRAYDSNANRIENLCWSLICINDCAYFTHSNLSNVLGVRKMSICKKVIQLIKGHLFGIPGNFIFGIGFNISMFKKIILKISFWSLPVLPVDAVLVPAGQSRQ